MQKKKKKNADYFPLESINVHVRLWNEMCVLGEWEGGGSVCFP